MKGNVTEFFLIFCEVNSKHVSFDNKIAARGCHVYKNATWKNAKAGQEVKVQVETNKSSKESDPYACAIKVKNNFFDNWMTVGHIPREISRHCFYFIQEGESISGQLLSTNYKVSPIPAGGLEVPLLLTFSVIEDRIFSLIKTLSKTYMTIIILVSTKAKVTKKVTTMTKLRL